MIIRDAKADDAQGIADIYNEAVLHSTAIWNEIPVDADNRARWIADHERDGFPVLAAIDEDGRVAGYATFGAWRPHDGYRHTVEHSVYVRADCRGKGLGETLLARLIEEARRLGKHAMVAGIEAGNKGSIALHKKLGFREVGLLPEVGAKFGKWLDLAFLQLTLDERKEPDVR